MYDYLLGGKDNYASDREAVEEVVRLAPDTPFMARENRAFLGRAVRFFVESGIRQFIDIGAGLPTQGNVHEIAQQLAPDARVVYVDNDPVVRVHGQALLANDDKVAIIHADARRPDEILRDPELRALIDFGEPVGLLMLAILHFICAAEDPRGIVTKLHAAVPSGSFLAISHVTADFHGERIRAAGRVYDRATSQIAFRSHAEIRRLFDGFELMEPGLTTISLWRPLPGTIPPLGAERQWAYGGVGLKPVPSPAP